MKLLSKKPHSQNNGWWRPNKVSSKNLSCSSFFLPWSWHRLNMRGMRVRGHTAAGAGMRAPFPPLGLSELVPCFSGAASKPASEAHTLHSHRGYRRLAAHAYSQPRYTWRDTWIGSKKARMAHIQWCWRRKTQLCRSIRWICQPVCWHACCCSYVLPAIQEAAVPCPSFHNGICAKRGL